MIERELGGHVFQISGGRVVGVWRRMDGFFLRVPVFVKKLTGWKPADGLRWDTVRILMNRGKIKLG